MASGVRASHRFAHLIGWWIAPTHGQLFHFRKKLELAASPPISVSHRPCRTTWYLDWPDTVERSRQIGWNLRLVKIFKRLCQGKASRKRDYATDMFRVLYQVFIADHQDPSPLSFRLVDRFGDRGNTGVGETLCVVRDKELIIVPLKELVGDGPVLG